VAQPVADDAFLQVVESLRLASPVQIKVARDLRAEGARQGLTLPMPDALVRMGVLTPAQRDEVFRRLRGRRPGYVVKVGRYSILRKLGSGGMGAVYLAEDDNRRGVAIKILPRHIAKDPSQAARLRREAEAMAKLNHANIVRAYSTGEIRGRPFLVMEYCEGESLDRRLRREERIRTPEAIRLLIQVACALQYAHARDIVHRDIKPGNIMVTPAGEAKLLDLGLSKRIGLPDTTMTQTGQFMGTPCYIAPEQAQGDRELDGRADIYALGATLFHLVTGRPPYTGQTAVEIVSQHVLSPVPDPREIRQGIPEEVAFVIRKMMAKLPADRYQDCGALREDLERVDTGRVPRGMPRRPPPRVFATSVTAPLPPILPPVPPQPPAPPPRRSTWIAFKLLVLLALLSALAIVLDRQGIVRLPVRVPLPHDVEAWLGWDPAPGAVPGGGTVGGSRPETVK
jgi:serine/threonine-protein kinase